MYILRNSNGVTVQVKKGFSWTMLFFGMFVPLLRGDFKWFFISGIAAMLTSGMSWLIFPFFITDYISIIY